MIYPPSIFLYGVMGLLTGIVSLNTFLISKNTGSVSFKNFSLFFFFVFLFLIGVALLVYLSIFLSDGLITIGLIGIRLFIFLAIFYLLQVLFLQSGNLERFNKYVISLLICIFTISTILQIIYFQAVTITNEGIIVYNMNRIAAWFIGLTSLAAAFVWSFGQILFFLKETEGDILLKIKAFMFFIGGLAVGFGDFIFVLAQNFTQSLSGSLLGATGYLLTVSVIIISYFQRLTPDKQ